MKNKGITLISLIMTIVLMTILAGIGVSFILPNIDTLKTQSVEQAELARMAEIKEARDEWLLECQYAEELGYTPKSIEELTEELITQNVITQKEAEQIKDNKLITVNNENIRFEPITTMLIQGQNVAYIPKGYAVSLVEGENLIEEGLVIYEGEEPVTDTSHATALTTRNQYVWIPVKDINNMVMCKSNSETSICELTLEGNILKCIKHSSTDLCGRLYGEASTYISDDITNSLSSNHLFETSMDFANRSQTYITNSEYREPDIITDYDTDGSTYLTLAGIKDGKASSLKQQLQTDFNEMAASVAKYHGFYIARYESGENGTSRKDQAVLTSYTSNGTNYLAGNRWYRII